MTELKRVEINKGDVGRIIGRGGATIKMLTSSYGVRLDVPKEDTDGDGKLDVSIEGASQGVRDCLTKMAQILGYIPSPVGGAEPPSAILKKDLNAPVIREVLFFPDPTGKNFETFLAFLRSATKTIDIAAFTLSDQAISDYLIVAHKAGIRVRIVTDNETVSNKGSDCKALAKAGIAVHMDGAESFGGGDHGTESLFHHKVGGHDVFGCALTSSR